MKLISSETIVDWRKFKKHKLMLLRVRIFYPKYKPIGLGASFLNLNPWQVASA